MAVVRVDNNFQILPTIRKLTVVRITDIILDPSHDKFEDYGSYDSIGTIFYTELNQSNPNTDSTARPLFTFVKNYPLINELVLITSTKDKDNKTSAYYFPILNVWNHPHQNALPFIENTQDTNYEQAIERKLEDGSTGINLGRYFQERLDIKPLLPYEGDTIIEGRFGNSIRFGSTNISDKVGTPNGWSNVGELGDPITIIKNGQPELDNKGWVHNIEDISNDISSIYLTSNQQLSNFTPASLNQKSFGANLVETKTIQEQLTDTFQTAPVIETQIEEETLDFEQPITVTDSTPLPPPEPEEYEASDDPFGDYAEELLDEPGIMEITAITGTENPDDEDEVYDDDKVGEIENNDELEYGKPIISKRNKDFSVTCHVPQTVYNLKQQIDIQPISDRVKYLVIHTTAGNQADTHLDLAHYFMQKAGDGAGWTRHGYHISIDSNGKCVQIYPDNEKSYGVGTPGKGNNKSDNIGNYNTINISWIGGAGSFNMTKNQANSINELVKFYQTRYSEIKIVGHNQIANKSCPWFYVPSYCRQLKNIPESNIYSISHTSIDFSKFGPNHIKVASKFTE